MHGETVKKISLELVNFSRRTVLHGVSKKGATAL